MIIKKYGCSCRNCRHVYKVENKPGMRFGKSRKKFKCYGKRSWKHCAARLTWLKSVRRRDPLKHEMPKITPVGYTD